MRKFYYVLCGYKLGLSTSWDECKYKGFHRAKFKDYKTLAKAKPFVIN